MVSKEGFRFTLKFKCQLGCPGNYQLRLDCPFSDRFDVGFFKLARRQVAVLTATELLAYFLALYRMQPQPHPRSLNPSACFISAEILTQLAPVTTQLQSKRKRAAGTISITQNNHTPYKFTWDTKISVQKYKSKSIQIFTRYKN